ncbi:Lactose permease [Colletotrichum orbiculare MAFF 240422]|uniref:Lactose permease n=1 Tax=Colletotrichum orbiculare (strain 104-T / ATCC 96160 / CBS 514.97 / LARS 414 / MAFF 240422) TaxID=1213857 RepID=N4VFU0_COLOR|nr:Lactose permease [Colletotrichum orbiculare MAFF 240422]
MSAIDEKHEEVHDVKHAVVATKTAVGDEAFQQAMIKEPPSWFGNPLLIPAIIVAFCCSTANGYDGSLFGTLLSNKDFKAFFGVDNKGIEAGIVTAMYQIGSVVSIPFIGPVIDTLGRRRGMFTGALVIVIGVIIQVTCINTNSVNQFMAGRFLLGFGVQIAASAGPIYVVEIAHPAHRGICGGLYNVMWPVGALVASGAARGSLPYGGNTSWLIPVGLQAMFPGIIVLGALFLPESPRWLYTNNRREEAQKVLTDLHAHGNPNSEWVRLQLNEYEEFLELEGSDKKWWDYRALFKTRASIYRLMCNCIVATFGQLAGNSIVSYFLSAFLDTAGIRGDKNQMNVQLGMNAIQIVFASVGASFTDLAGRRPMLVIVNILCGLCWIGVIVPASIANITDKEDESQIQAVDGNVSRAMLAWVYIFQICYSVGWTPLQALYPVEVLNYEIRAKGMAFSGLFMNTALLSTQFGCPEALKVIQWRTYIVFCCWCFVQAGVLYLLVPETKNRTLEELDRIFASKSPVKASTEKKLYEVDADANILHVDTVEHRNVSAI